MCASGTAASARSWQSESCVHGLPLQLLHCVGRLFSCPRDRRHRFAIKMFLDLNVMHFLQRFREHLADVLTLAASPAGDTVFAAGVDQRLAVFQRTTAAAASTSSPNYKILLYSILERDSIRHLQAS